jgi:alkylation response protein AidB-like acyl-CoA dehydrogenase
MTETMKQCEQTARAEGLATGLMLALNGCDVLAMAPGRYAAVPAKTAPDELPVVTHSLASGEDVVLVDRGRRSARAMPTSGGSAELAAFGQRLAAVRLGLTRRLLDAATEHLSNRFGGDEPLVRKQLVTGAIADIIAGVELLRASANGLPAAGEPLASLADLHARITELDLEVIRLFGAAGYIADHPVRALYVSALVANTWMPEGAQR